MQDWAISSPEELLKPTDKKAGQQARSGARFLSDVLADNVRALRSVHHRLTQAALAGRMAYLGHEWTQATVSEVERGVRNVSVDELLALAVSLEASPPELLDPEGIDGRRTEALDYGPGQPLPPRAAAHWLYGRVRIGLGRSWPEEEGLCQYTAAGIKGQERAFDETMEDIRASKGHAPQRRAWPTTETEQA
jgi:transcriptional regulator with XRE-family HTH domain